MGSGGVQTCLGPVLLLKDMILWNYHEISLNPEHRDATAYILKKCFCYMFQVKISFYNIRIALQHKNLLYESQE